MQPNAWTRREACAAATASLAAVAAALFDYAADPRRPAAATLDSGWWAFSDQGRYLTSALAWAAGRLDPAEHWYLPGYPLLAAPFIRLTPANPFLLPDLALLAATVWLTAALAGWLAPAWRGARIAGAAAALGAVLPPLALDVWVTPWTSTPEAALTLGCLLATLHSAARPGSARPSFIVGLCAGAVAAFRPADAILLALVAGAASAWALWRAWPGWQAAVRSLAASALGAGIAALPALAGYLAINGWQMNGYLTLSAAIGFEWRLLPLRWVTIMLDPRPLFPDGRGLVAAFPWVAAGLAGIVACLLRPPAGAARFAHALVAGAACAHIALYLCYRDLHPQGLWRFYNYHYFKWPLVLLALYAVLLLRLVRERRWAAVLAGACSLAILLPWRAELQPVPHPGMTAQTGAVLHLPTLALGVRDVIIVPAHGSFQAIYSGQQNMYVGAQEEKWYSSTADMKVTPRPGGLMIAALRPLQPGPVTIRFGPGITLGDGAPALARQVLVYGAPCWTGWAPVPCDGAEPGPLHHPGETITLDGAEGGLLGAGWSGPEPDGRWTDGALAVLHLRVAPAAAALALTAHAFTPGGRALDLALSANGRMIGRWSLSEGAEQVLRADLPPGILGPAGELQLALAVADPRRPHDTLPDSADTRLLGLSVRALTLGP